ncbi:MAG: hypothetical protein RJA70_4048, partial [Pseudomonadota bacterium]
LVNNFQGRVSCPHGQLASPAPGGTAGGETDGRKCMTPDGTERVEVAVKRQLAKRIPENAVYCSCRCKAPAGPKSNAPLCECPDGFKCEDLLSDYGFGDRQLAGSYCVRQGTQVEAPSQIDPAECGTGVPECSSPEFN